MKRTLIALLLCLHIATASADDAQVVAAAYPQRLLNEYAIDFQDGATPPVQFSSFAPVGDDLLVAAYTNGFTGAIRLLRRDGTVVSEPALRISGVIPLVEAVNLDGTGNDEVIVSFSSPRGREADWVFRRDGGALVLIGPSGVDGDGQPYPTLVDAGWLDLDGDGTLELYAPSGEFGDFDAPPQPHTFDVYKLSTGRYVLSGSLTYVRQFHRTTGAPNVVTESFLAVPGAYTLKIGNKGVSSAAIHLNGRSVVAPNLLTPNAHTVAIDVILQSSNTISVDLGSAPGTSLTVGIERR